MIAHLDGMVVKVRDDNLVFGVDGDKMRTCQAIPLASPRAEFLHQFSVGLKDKHAAGFVVHHDQMSGSVNRYTFWACNAIRIFINGKQR